MTVLKIALNATSVLPNPTSPQSNRSIGISFFKSFKISSEHLIWSFVASYAKFDAKTISSGNV